MSRLCRDCSAPIEPPKQLCDVCRATIDRMRRLEERDIDLRLASICPRCREPWRPDRSRDRKICQACEDKGELPKSKMTAKQKREFLAKLNKKYDD